MALDKLVDSTQLDSDLTSVANAIRTKGGTSAQLAFPSGFVSAINDISGGGGTDYLALDVVGQAFTYSNNSITTIRSQAFNSSYATSIDIPNATSIGGGAFQSSKITKAFFPKGMVIGQNAFNSCASLQVAVVGGNNTNAYRYMFYNCGSRLTAVDLTKSKYICRNDFSYDSALTTIILRSTDRVSLGGIDAFNSTPFASGGAGGTIYIPKVLYDHLGDGTSSDYQAATNWSTIHGYGTITWAKIEGSTYETHYADGTAIPTT